MVAVYSSEKLEPINTFALKIQAICPSQKLVGLPTYKFCTDNRRSMFLANGSAHLLC